MRSEASLCGLSLAVAAQGDAEACAQFAAALEQHASAPGPRGSLAGEDRFALDLKLLSGFSFPPDRLSVSRVGDSFAVNGDGLSGTIGESAGRLEVFGGRAAALQIAVRLACALWLAPRRGLLLHGASVDIDGKALAFLGQSGAGKSTLSRRLESAGARIIADEVAAVRAPPAGSLERSARLFGHPLPRRVGDGCAPPEGLPLQAIGILAHAEPGQGPSTRRLDHRQSVQAILRRVFLPAADGSLVEGALATADALARALPVFALSLPDDDRAIPAALALLEPQAREVIDAPRDR